MKGSREMIPTETIRCFMVAWLSRKLCQARLEPTPLHFGQNTTHHQHNTINCLIVRVRPLFLRCNELYDISDHPWHRDQQDADVNVEPAKGEASSMGLSQGCWDANNNLTNYSLKLEKNALLSSHYLHGRMTKFKICLLTLCQLKFRQVLPLVA